MINVVGLPALIINNKNIVVCHSSYAILFCTVHMKWHPMTYEVAMHSAQEEAVEQEVMLCSRRRLINVVNVPEVEESFCFLLKLHQERVKIKSIYFLYYD